MDPCEFRRVVIECVSLKLPNRITTRRHVSGDDQVHPACSTVTPWSIKLKLKNIPSQTTIFPLKLAAKVWFHLDSEALRRLSPAATLRISACCGKKAIGRGKIGIGMVGAESKAAVMIYSGWVKLGEEARVQLVVKSEPDPRFVFRFGGAPQFSPLVFQIQGTTPQPVFSLNFTAYTNNNNSRSVPSEYNTKSIKSRMMRTFSINNHKDTPVGGGRERKGWTITVHDLSGSPVATALMTTPFVPSPGGSDRVSRSNPGAWLILRPHASGWKPWGRLEAWRERSALGCRFRLAGAADPIAEATVSASKGGRFSIEARGAGEGGFAMECSVGGEGRHVSRPLVVVHVGVHHVTCTADAALFVALAAAVDLSMDACRLFSRKLRRELSHVH